MWVFKRKKKFSKIISTYWYNLMIMANLRLLEKEIFHFSNFFRCFPNFIQSDSDAVNLFKYRMEILCIGAGATINRNFRLWFQIKLFLEFLLYEVLKIVVYRKSVRLIEFLFVDNFNCLLVCLPDLRILMFFSSLKLNCGQSHRCGIYDW